MKIEITELFKVVTPEEGRCLYDGDSPTLIAYMPLDSDPESYWSEINIEDAPWKEDLDFLQPQEELS